MNLPSRRGECVSRVISILTTTYWDLYPKYTSSSRVALTQSWVTGEYNRGPRREFISMVREAWASGLASIPAQDTMGSGWNASSWYSRRKSTSLGTGNGSRQGIKLVSWIVAVVASFGTSKIWLNSCESLWFQEGAPDLSFINNGEVTEIKPLHMNQYLLLLWDITGDWEAQGKLRILCHFG